MKSKLSPNPSVPRPTSSLSLRTALPLSAALMCLAASIEFAMGRTPLSKSGTIKLWVTDINSAENSQQLADWYSFTHITHGILFFAAFRLLSRRRLSVPACFLLTIFLESAWEVLENTPFIIDRYRAATISKGYYGDSILNSMSDILCCALGFFLARKLPVWLTISLVLFMEIGLAYAIRDNLLLNIIMLIHPTEAIKHWQAGG